MDPHDEKNGFGYKKLKTLPQWAFFSKLPTWRRGLKLAVTASCFKYLSAFQQFQVMSWFAGSQTRRSIQPTPINDFRWFCWPQPASEIALWNCPSLVRLTSFQDFFAWCITILLSLLVNLWKEHHLFRFNSARKMKTHPAGILLLERSQKLFQFSWTFLLKSFFFQLYAGVASSPGSSFQQDTQTPKSFLPRSLESLHWSLALVAEQPKASWVKASFQIRCHRRDGFIFPKNLWK